MSNAASVTIVRGDRPNLHGRFDGAGGPVAWVESGAVVSFRDCPDVGWGLEPPTSSTALRRKVEGRVPPRDDGPCLCGPVGVRDAEPGDAVEITIQQFHTTDWGWTYAGGGVTPPGLAQRLGLIDEPLRVLRWSIDPTRRVAIEHAGTRVPLLPFPGCLGLASADPNADGWTPRATGGNMDCPELVSGTSLWLPVEVPGAMLSIGDGHAAQGEGELSGTAIECGIVRADLRLTLHKGLHLRGPRIRTPGAWITLGFGRTLDEAAAQAASSMLDMMAANLSLPRSDALALASSLVSLRITQLVNPLVGVHAILRDRPSTPVRGEAESG